MKNIKIILKRLNELSDKKFSSDYRIPGIWDNQKDKNSIIYENKYRFYKDKIEEILNYKAIINNNNLQDEIIYNLMPRLTGANIQNFDKKNIINTGTILDTISLLPYLKSIGVTILYFLPINSIGKYNKKGNLGSVYAIRNHYNLDENLNDNLLNIDLEIQFSALIEAAHHIGIKVVCEFIFRTTSIDSDLALIYPEWFYWIKLSKIKEFTSPLYSKEDLIKIKQMIDNNIFNDSIQPPKNYMDMYTEVPVRVYRKDEMIIGELMNGELVTIPNAFADWPPDDNQPMWSDVTYLKYFNNPNFNYIAYNTVRMYDTELLENEKHFQNDLFEYIINIVPYYIDKYNLDGIMLDMGHSLPHFIRKSIIEKSRKVKKDFIFFEENFIPNENSLKEGFNALVGYLIFDLTDVEKTKNYIYRLENNEIKIPVFATAENHNTPRVQSKNCNPKFSVLMYAIASFLPYSIRFIHSGFELLENKPVNTGLNFSDYEIKKFTELDLPLFSISSLNWEKSIVDEIIIINQIRAEIIKDSIINYKVMNLENDVDSILSFMIYDDNKSYIFVANYSENDINCKINLKNNYKKVILFSTKRIFEVDQNFISLEIKAFDFIIGILN